ncbi:lytic murein transglycosylase [Parashewanella tropica]|uniref:lytic murein transglycosylase n=1 Tax=Parashewanella tropica TaxID=2547970 RepID=UPI00147853BE|nr:lytic murein transglycosylase [Parashewanella tropica]
MASLFVQKASVVFTLAFSINSYANNISFKDFVNNVLSSPQSNLSAAEVDTLLPKIKQFKKLGEPPVSSDSNIFFEDYLTRVVDQQAIDYSYAKHQNYSHQLQAISKQYSVQPRFIVALWAVVSNFGKSKANYSALSVYASKAYDEHDEGYKNELVAAVSSVKAGYVSIEEISSDYHGNLGLLSISPSFYYQYAVDWDNDGKKDIWHNHLDSFATIANFLNKQGWDHTATWGRQVKLTRALNDETNLTQAQNFNVWSQRGITKFNGSPLSSRADIYARLLKVPNSKGRYYLTYNNFDVLGKWPKMDDYRLLSVMYLSERLNRKIKGF